MSVSYSSTSSSGSSNSDYIKRNKFYELLVQIQLETFWQVLKDKLQVTQLSHFEYVKEKDLEKIGMSRPAISRLLDAVDKAKKQHTQSLKLHIRPAPLPPTNKSLCSPSNFSFNSNISQETSHTTNKSKLYNNNLNKTLLSSKILNRLNNKNEENNAWQRKRSLNNVVSQPYSVIINQSDIKMLKNSRGEEEILGMGHFGVVKKALWKMPNGTRITVAVKCLHENFMDANFDINQAQLDVINEVSCMSSLEHENLIKLFGIVLTSQKSSGFMMMVTEIAPLGSLLNYLRKKREADSHFRVAQLNAYIYQIASGMEFLEANKLVHRDLACRNILLFTIEQVKICDFGMTRNVKKDGVYKMKETHKIPCAWYPPESIREKIFSHKSDVWMFAVTCWEIFTYGEHPWPNMSAAEILNKIETEAKRLPIPSICSKSIYSILNQCWSKEPDDRPSFQMLKKLLSEIKLSEMRAKEDYKQENKLDIERGDVVSIIEGYAAKYWWKGQNNRTLKVGYFPRSILDPLRQINSEDISLPLKNSFIHTGHMSSGNGDRTWGNPQTIDPIFLSNPLNPPDLLIDPAQSEPTLANADSAVNRVEIISNKTMNDNINPNDSVNLLEFSFSETNNTQNNFHDHSESTDSFSSAKSASPSSQTSSQRNFPRSLSVSNQSSPYNSFNNPLANFDLLGSREEAPNCLPRVYYNDEMSAGSFLPKIELASLGKNEEDYARISIESRPFRDSYANAESAMNNDEFYSNGGQTKNRRFDFSQNKNQTVDEFLSKVMNDVMNDFRKSKTSNTTFN